MLVQERHGRQARVPGSHDGGHGGVELSGESIRQGEHNRVSEITCLPPSLAGRDFNPDLERMSCNIIIFIISWSGNKGPRTQGRRMWPRALVVACALQTRTHLLLNLRRRSVRSSRMRSMLAREICGCSITTHISDTIRLQSSFLTPLNTLKSEHQYLIKRKHH